MKKNIGKIIFVIIAAIIILPIFVFAEERAQIDISIPCISCNNASGDNPVGLIADFYELALAVSGILALGVIIFAGIKRIVGANKPGEVAESNDMIFNALLGIVLLFGAYILLNTINPELTKLEIPKLSQIEVKPPTESVVDSYQCDADADGVRAASCHDTMEDCVAKCSELARDKCRKVSSCRVSDSACPIAGFTPLTDPDALAMEGGDSIKWTSSNPSVQANLDRLKIEVNKYIAAINAAGASATINSVYRPESYQKHLYEIYDMHQRLQSLTPLQRKDCASLENEFKAETNKHEICGKYAVCYVVKSAGPHGRGTGVDIRVRGTLPGGYQSFLDSKGIKLSWLGPKDDVHYNLK